MYKEDVDLAWRLRNFGWNAVYVPTAYSYHYRSSRQAENFRFQAIRKNRQSRSPLANFYSYRNHGAVMLKNDFFTNALLHLPIIWAYELAKFAYVVAFEPRLIFAIPAFLSRMPRFLRKRFYIIKKARVRPEEIREWMK